MQYVKPAATFGSVEISEQNKYNGLIVKLIKLSGFKNWSANQHTCCVHCLSLDYSYCQGLTEMP